MGQVTIAAPLRVEAWAVRRGAPTATVVRTGMGVARSRVSRAKLVGDQPLVVMGVAGGLAADVEVGDIVVGSELRGDVVTTCAGADDLADALRSVGHRVHVGPLITVDTIAHGPARAALAATGAIAVDMESAYLVADWPGRTVAVVRVISDTAAAPLLRPGVISRGIRCLRTLRAITPVVERWAVEDKDGQSGAGDTKGAS